MPSTSETQAKAARMALLAKQGKISPDRLKGAARQMYESMTAEQLSHFTKVKKK